MAINTHEELWKDKPYVHSKIFNFRMNAKNINSQYLKDGFDNAINQLTVLRNNLRDEAEAFLEGKDWKTASMELFNNPNTYSGIALRILRNENFLNVILENSKIDLSDPIISGMFREEFINKANLMGESIDAKSLAGLIAKNIDLNSNDKTVKISVVGKEAFKEETIGEIIENGFKYVRKNNNTEQKFTKRLSQYLNSKSGTNWEQVWEYFKQSFLSIIQNEGIKFHYTNFTPNDFLDKLKPLFMENVEDAYAKDVGNATGVIGENIKDAIFKADSNGATLEWKFENIGPLTIDEIQKRTLPNSIKIIKKSQEESIKGASDWIVRNSKGMIVQMQDKNSIVLLNKIKEEANMPQSLKVQDIVQYTTLKNQMINYGSLLSEEDWKILEYYIVNIVWQRKTPNSFYEQFNIPIKSQNYRYKMEGIQEQINKILSKNIAYLLGININNFSKDINIVAQGAGGSNTFFIIDNLFIYPTYLIIEDIINELNNNKDNLTSVYATLDLSSVSGINPKQLWSNKLSIIQSSDWNGGCYGDRMIEEGTSAGMNVINQIKFSRINTKMNVNKILKSSLSIDLSKI